MSTVNDQNRINGRIDAEAALARLDTLDMLQAVRAELVDRQMKAWRAGDQHEAERLQVASRDLDVDIQRYIGISSPSRRRPQVVR